MSMYTSWPILKASTYQLQDSSPQPDHQGFYLVWISWSPDPILAYWSPSRGWTEWGIKLNHVVEFAELPKRKGKV